jgi:hypothetical protein
MSTFQIARIARREDLDIALARRKTMSHLRLGDALVQENLITQSQRDAALAMQAADPGQLLGEILVANAAITRQDLRRVLAEQLGVPAVNLAQFESAADAIRAVPADLARLHTVMPLYRSAKRIAVAIENPLSLEALRELERATGLRVDPAMASREHLLAAIARAYGPELVETLPREPTLDTTFGLVALATKIFGQAHAAGTLSIRAESIPERAGALRFHIQAILPASQS